MGIVAEFDAKNKHKMRVLQVERGVSGGDTCQRVLRAE